MTMDDILTIRRGLLLAAAVLCIVSVACSASGNNTTWSASFSYPPTTLSAGAKLQPALTLADVLGQDPFWSETLPGGYSVGCDAANQWAVVDALGCITLPLTPLAGALLDVQLESDRVTITTSISRYEIVASSGTVTLFELGGR
ncbi:MAG: hypothetical protein WC712_12965 [Candidatus Brocadiia bacterium]